MLKRHPRTPAACVLTAAAVLCLLYVCSYGRIVRAKDPSSLEQLESTIAHGNADAHTWLAYAGKLDESRRPAEAAVAYAKYLEGSPHDRDAQIRFAAALSDAGDGEGLLRFLKTVVYADPKLVVAILDGPTGAGRRGTPEFDALYREAVSQAMD